eukprot:937766_1
MSLTKIHYKNEHREYIHMKNRDAIKTKTIFEFECPRHWIQVLELEIHALASDQNWGNTGHDYFDLIITKSNEKNKTFRLFSINHKKHKGFYKYSVKYVHGTNNAGPLQEIESGDQLTVRCHCAPYPRWEIKVKHAEISMIYLQRNDGIHRKANELSDTMSHHSVTTSHQKKKPHLKHSEMNDTFPHNIDHWRWKGDPASNLIEPKKSDHPSRANKPNSISDQTNVLPKTNVVRHRYRRTEPFYDDDDDRKSDGSHSLNARQCAGPHHSRRIEQMDEDYEIKRDETRAPSTWYEVTKPTRVSAIKSNGDGSRSLNVRNAWTSTNKNGDTSKVGTAAVGTMKTVGSIGDTLIFSTGKVDGKRVSVKRGEEDGKRGRASYDILGASAGTQKSKLGVKAHANAHVAHADAMVKTHLPGELFAPNVSSDVLAANASADASVIGVRAQADATVVKAQAGFKGTPINVSASGPSAKAGAACRLDDIEASAGAYLAEATAGPFAVREGVKFGAGVKNGVPFVDAGPVSCLIM